MDNVKNMIESNEKVIEYYIFGCLCLSVLNCIERADYNFFIFLFIYYTMIMKHKFQPNPNNIKNERLFMSLSFIISFIIDFIWIVIYKNKNINLSILLSWIEIIIKIPVFFIVLVMWLGSNKTIFKDNNDNFEKLDEEE